MKLHCPTLLHSNDIFQINRIIPLKIRFVYIHKNTSVHHIVYCTSKNSMNLFNLVKWSNMSSSELFSFKKHELYSYASGMQQIIIYSIYYSAFQLFPYRFQDILLSFAICLIQNHYQNFHAYLKVIQTMNDN